MRPLIIVTLTIIGICIIFYLSWLPNPNLGLLSYFPEWLTKWTDARENANIRTSIPFILLGFTGEVVVVLDKEVNRKRKQIVISLTAVVIIAELGQLFLPLRHFDLSDIGWGIAGALFGLFIGIVAKKL